MNAAHLTSGLVRLSSMLFLVTVVGLSHGSAIAGREKSAIDQPPAKDQSILIALLLDTSNSMDGLIDQAKSQLWKIVNELSHARCDGNVKPTIKIALYEYGNDGLRASDGYVRLVNGLTDDLDVISEKLFSLTTNGGNEFCGQVINTSLNQLAWTTSSSDLKMIFIAGNEPFDQGQVSYQFACTNAKEKGVVVNTIYCGDFSEGVSTAWKKGADLTGGTYMNIDQNRRTIYIITPYDEQLEVLNTRLNDTYIYYGSKGASKKELQIQQDNNAVKYGMENKAERTISKSSHLYKNSTWDLVDASKDDTRAIEKIDSESLPTEMKGMSIQQRREYVQIKSREREALQKQIQDLSKKRGEYIAMNSNTAEKTNMLDGVMIRSLKDKAQSKNMRWD